MSQRGRGRLRPRGVSTDSRRSDHAFSLADAASPNPNQSLLSPAGPPANLPRRASTETHILHYVAPISPVAVRLPPHGFQVVMGPLSGNIYYPPAFNTRMGRRDRIRKRLHGVTQWLMGRIFGDKKRADVILNSGYERTRSSLRIAGCREEQFIDVIDAGIGPQLSRQPRIQHQERNTSFITIGRLIDVKAIDLAIRALAQTDPSITLDIRGKGEKQAWLEALTRDLGLENRVAFRGWLAHKDLAKACAPHRGFVFPSLADFERHRHAGGDDAGPARHHARLGRAGHAGR